jgi:hypothetical protein
MVGGTQGRLVANWWLSSSSLEYVSISNGVILDERGFTLLIDLLQLGHDIL